LDKMATFFISNLEKSVKFRSNAYAWHLLDDQIRWLQTEILFLFESSNVLSWWPRLRIIRQQEIEIYGEISPAISHSY
jgi:hypothetical protein